MYRTGFATGSLVSLRAMDSLRRPGIDLSSDEDD
jgi:hypothetical protein